MDGMLAEPGAAPSDSPSAALPPQTERPAAGLFRLVSKPWHLVRHSLVARLTLSAIAVAMLFVALGVGISLATTRVSDRIEQGDVLREASIASSKLNTSIAEARYHATRYAATGDRTEIGKARATLAAAKSRFAATLNGFASNGQQARQALQLLGNDVDGFDEELAGLEHSAGTRGASQTSRGLAKAIDISGGQLALELRSVEANFDKASAASDDALTKLMRRAKLIVMALLVVCVAVTLFGARFVARTTAGSIQQITQAMSRLAEGDRDIAVPGTERLDEIGEMARALEVFRLSALELSALQQEAAEAAQKEIARREEVRQERLRLTAELADKFEATVGQLVGSVAAASSQLQDTANSMAATASKSSQHASEVAQSMDGTLDRGNRRGIGERPVRDVDRRDQPPGRELG